MIDIDITLLRRVPTEIISIIFNALISIKRHNRVYDISCLFIWRNIQLIGTGLNRKIVYCDIKITLNVICISIIAVLFSITVLYSVLSNKLFSRTREIWVSVDIYNHIREIYSTDIFGSKLFGKLRMSKKLSFPHKLINFRLCIDFSHIERKYNIRNCAIRNGRVNR